MYRFVAYLGLPLGVFFAASGLSIAVKRFLPPPPPLFNFRMSFFEQNPDLYNILIGLLLIAYGAFRFYRSFRMIRENRREI
jgi:hypothetical protein